MQRWLVIIARDRPELWVTWASFYGGGEKVEVIFDRRQGQPWTERRGRPDRRTQPNRDAALRERGHLVISQSELMAASR
jgi:hypothetical protein